MMDDRSGAASITSYHSHHSHHSHHSGEFVGLPDVVDDNQSVVLLSMVQRFDWHGALTRIQQFPEECKAVSFRGRMALHVACAAHDVPVEIIQSLIQAYPEACIHAGTTGMNPLHIACSSDHASINVIRVLLTEASKVNLAGKMCSMQDVDRDTPLHSACRCGASLDALRMLMLIYPDAVHQRDYEGLTPLLRLWVREYVLLGEGVINAVKGPKDLVGELGQAWQKTMLLLYCSYVGSLQPLVKRGEGSNPPGKVFRPMHAVASIDCPRRVVKIATIVHHDELLVRDENGMTPLLLAAKAPIYRFRDIADDGSDLEDKLEDHLYEEDDEMAYEEDPEKSLPSVIDLLMKAEPSASKIKDPSGKSALELAIESGKKKNEGVGALTDVEGLEITIEKTLKITPDESM